jgi:Peptidase family M50
MPPEMDTSLSKPDRFMLERRYRVFRRIITVALSLGLVMLGVRSQPKQAIPSSLLVILLSAFLILILSVFLHEVGHVLAGWLVGMRLRSFAVMQFLVYKTVSGWRIRWDSKLGFLGGLVLNYSTISTGFRWRNVVMVAGGPAVNLFLAITAFVFSLSMPADPWGKNSWFGQPFFHLNLLIGVSLYFFFNNIWPSRGSGFENDGMLLLQLIQNDPRLKQEAALSSLIGTAMTGQRPRDWNLDWLLEAADLQNRKGIDELALLFTYYRALDTHAPELAGQTLDRLLEQIEGVSLSMRWDVLLEATYFEAFHRQNLNAAQAWFLEAQGHQSDPALGLRAEAALALVEGQANQALELTERAQLNLDKSQIPGIAIAERDWLQELIVAAARYKS